MLFASPDLAANAACCLLFVWVVILWCAGRMGIRGLKLWEADSPQARKKGRLLILAAILLPLSFYFLPRIIIRIEYGNAPLWRYPNELHKGMTKDEVEAVLGTPHNRVEDDDRERWYYWLDSYGLGYVSVGFGPHGRVTSIDGN